MFEDLNPMQAKAVQTTEGPLLVLAGAGTGKTKVLSYRIAYIIKSSLADASEILALTFTNKAAKEMLHRIANILPNSNMTIGTFHSVAAKILRQRAELVGLSSAFSIIDIDDQLKIIKNLLIDMNIDTKEYPPQMILGIISKWKDLGILPDKVSNADIFSKNYSIAKGIYASYQMHLVKSNLVDFGDLILYNLEIFTKYPEILTYYQEKYKYLLVDEYQDTNVVQYLWIRMLVAKHNNICCVGDDDQSIYSWRGAEVANILRFSKDYKNAQIIKLEQNYRSTTPILAAATQLIKCNKNRHGKELWTNTMDGPPVKLVYCFNEKEEARFIIEEIKQKLSTIDYNNIAILVRAGFQTRAFEESLIANALPYRIIGGLKFYERKEIRDILAYIRVVINNEDDIALERIINIPKRSIGDATIDTIKSFAKNTGTSMLAAIDLMIERQVFKPKVHDILKDFINKIKGWKALFYTTTPYNVTKKILEESGYQAMLKSEKTDESISRLENLNEMLRAISEFEKIEYFLEHSSLVTDGDLSGDIPNAVNLMTMHAAKGLEFELVFLPGWEEGLFPHQKSIKENKEQGVEEERRLAYVGITRAKHELYISYAKNRRIFNEFVNPAPSRFLQDIDNPMIQKIFSHTYHNPVYTKPQNILSNTNSNIPKSNLGKYVIHPSFGKGIVIKANGDNIEVVFNQNGIKTIKKEFLTFCD